MKVLGVITARGGSKGIPGKNLKLLAGKPLIVYTLEAAADSGVLDRLIVSTDDRAIADVARAHGCEVPFLRPPELAQDDTPHLPVMQHAVAWLRDQEAYHPDDSSTHVAASSTRGHSQRRGVTPPEWRGLGPHRQRSLGAYASDANFACC
jgi:CMP-N-acetylneuraminic acid synthetase